MRVVTVCLALFLCSAATMFAQTRGEFTPAPCPDRPWQYASPDLEALPDAHLWVGRYDGGLYAAEVPNRWNGELVLWQHGNVAETNPLKVQVPALREHWIAQGFAWAASSFRCNGPVIGIGLLDTIALQRLLPQLTGGRTPARVYLAGESNGGYGTIMGLRYFPSQFAGGLAMCPASGVLGLAFRIAVADAATRIAGLDFSLPDMQSRIGDVFGVPPNYTAKGLELADVQIALSGGPRPFAVEGLIPRFAANIAPAEDSDRYRAAKGDRALRDHYGDWAAFDGQIRTPLLTIHATGDLTAPITNEREFRLAFNNAGTEQWLVQRIMRVPNHCRFTQQEQAAAFDDLVAWVRTGTRPEGDDVTASFGDAGTRFTRPLRPGDPGTRVIGR